MLDVFACPLLDGLFLLRSNRVATALYYQAGCARVVQAKEKIRVKDALSLRRTAVVQVTDICILYFNSNFGVLKIYVPLKTQEQGRQLRQRLDVLRRTARTFVLAT